MSMPLVANALAEAEIDHAREYHDRVRTGLDDDSLSRVVEALDRIRHNPLMHAVVHADLWRSRSHPPA